jgi:ABC-2 type transport system permease protein
MFTIFRKELADHFGSVRFLILFCVILMVAMFVTYMAGSSLRDELEGVAKPSFVFLMMFTSGQYFSLVQFIAFFGPLIGLVMGFDAINRERNQGTLSKLVSQPIYRDAVINGKFLAGVATISIMLTSLMLLISGLGLLTLGVVPGGEETARLLVYLVLSIAYVAFWLGVSILFSIIFRSVATSALASVALWIFFIFIVAIGASMAANTLAPLDRNADAAQVLRHDRISRAATLVSPVVLYNDATSTILDPTRRSTQSLFRDLAGRGQYEQISMTRFNNPLPFDQSVLVVAPYLTTLLALTVICFGISYLAFMRQEIRSV